MEALILALVFLVSFALIAGLLIQLRKRDRVEDRLGELTAAPAAPEAEAAGEEGPRSVLEPLFRGLNVTERLRHELWRAGLTLRPTDFMGLLLLAALILGLLCYALTHRPVIAFVGALVGLGAPFAVLRVKQTQRRTAFEVQLPDALSLAASSLRSGYSFPQALQLVAQEMKPPMAEEMQWVLDETKIGVQLEEALGHLVDRVRSYDVELLVTAISIQYRVGGNLAELLDNLQETIRQRFRNRAEVSALTAEGRMSAAILIALPLVMLAVLTLRSPDYMQPLLDRPIGQMMLLVAAILQVVGGIVMKRMVSIDT